MTLEETLEYLRLMLVNEDLSPAVRIEAATRVLDRVVL